MAEKDSKKITNVDYRNTRGIIKNEELIASYGAMIKSFHKRVKDLRAVYKNEGTPRKINKLVLEDLAQMFGVDKVITGVGWRLVAGKPKKIGLIYLVKIKDDAGNSRFMNLVAYPSFVAMMEEARALGVKFIINSAYRDMATQKRLYQRYQEGGAKAAYPGTSKHQMGLALDIVALEKTQDTEDSTQIILSNIGPKYGWYRTVQSERWHFAFRYNKITTVPGEQDHILSAINSVTAFLAQPLISTDRTVAGIVRSNLDSITRARKMLLMTRKDYAGIAEGQADSRVLGSSQGVSELIKGLNASNNATQENSAPMSKDSPYTFDFSTGFWGDGKTGGLISNG